MVLIEELGEVEEEEVKVSAEAAAKPDSPKPAETAEEPAKPTVKKGFLNDSSKPLYGPEGSGEGKVAPETHKAHMENDLSNKLNSTMNPMEEAQGDLPKPEWYTPEWPKGCQYNAPGCTLAPMEESTHQTPLHKEMITKHERWQQALKGGQRQIRLSFMQIKDEDIAELMPALKGNEVLEELDLSHNEINDKGIQTIVGALANGAAPNLKELRVYENKWGELSKVMLESGLKVLRKKLVVHMEAPTLKFASTPAPPPAPSGPTGGYASTVSA